MELGSNAPLIVMPDADLEKVAQAVAATGYANAGQVCISTQRVLAAGRVYSDFLSALKPKVEASDHREPARRRRSRWARWSASGTPCAWTSGSRRRSRPVPAW